MERSLQEQLLLLKSVVENAPLPLGVYAGSELTIVLANEAMIKALGKGSEVLGKRYTDILPELEGQELFSQARGAMETGVPFHAKGTRVDIEIDGLLKTHYYDYSYIPLRDNDGNVFAIMNTGSDVTDLVNARHNVEQQVQQRTKELKRSNEDLLHFANAVSHDLKEPIRKISFFNNLLNQKIGENISEDASKYFGKVEDATNRMTSIVDGVLNYSKLSRAIRWRKSILIR